MMKLINSKFSILPDSRFFSLFILFFSALLIYAPLVKTEEVSNPEKSKEAGKNIDFKINWEKDKLYSISIDINQKISQEILGKKLDMVQKMTYEYTHEVSNIDENGNILIKFTLDSLKVNQETVTNEKAISKMEFDSTKEGFEKSPLAKFFKPLLGKSFWIKFSSKWELVEIQGLDKIISDASKELGPVLEKTMKSTFSEENIKRMFGSLTGWLPEKPVKIGDSWTKKFEIKEVFPMVITTTYKLKKIEDSVAHLEESAKITPGSNEGSTEALLNMKVKIKNISGNQVGECKVNKDTGLIVYSKVEQKISYEMGFEIPDEQSGETRVMNWPASIESTVIIKEKEREKTKLELASSLVDTAILEARQYAVVKNKIHYLFFETRGTTKPYMQIYMENSNPKNSTLELYEDTPIGDKKELPESVGFYQKCTMFAGNSHYIGFKPNGTLFFPPGVKGVDMLKFDEDPLNCDIGIIQPNDPIQASQGCFMQLGQVLGRIVDKKCIPFKSKSAKEKEEK